MELEHIRNEIERMRAQIHRQRKDILSLQRAGIGTVSAEELLARMQADVDGLCVRRERLIGEERVEKRVAEGGLRAQACRS